MHSPLPVPIVDPLCSLGPVRPEHQVKVAAPRPQDSGMCKEHTSTIKYLRRRRTRLCQTRFRLGVR
jgi:hypothetical protein